MTLYRENMWTVPLSEEHARYLEFPLKEIEEISARFSPLLNSFKYSPVKVEKILIIEPLSEAVATNVPSLLIEI